MEVITKELPLLLGRFPWIFVMQSKAINVAMCYVPADLLSCKHTGRALHSWTAPEMPVSSKAPT